MFKEIPTTIFTCHSDRGRWHAYIKQSHSCTRWFSLCRRFSFPGWSWPAKNTRNCMLLQNTLPC